MTGELFRAATAEVVAFHAAIERWFADPAADDAVFQPIAAALSHEFSMTTPEGRQIAEPLVVDMLREAKGRRGPDFRIRIERVRLVAETADLVAVVYEEHQEIAGERTRRHATALFRPAPSAPNGVQWLRVHETWMP